MATLIKVDGSETEVSPKNGKCFELEELQGFVGGYIEIIRLPSGQIMVLDEEGKFKNYLLNNRATVLGVAAGIAVGDYIVGDVLVCSSAELGE